MPGPIPSQEVVESSPTALHVVIEAQNASAVALTAASQAMRRNDAPAVEKAAEEVSAAASSAAHAATKAVPVVMSDSTKVLSTNSVISQSDALHVVAKAQSASAAALAAASQAMHSGDAPAVAETAQQVSAAASNAAHAAKKAVPVVMANSTEPESASPPSPSSPPGAGHLSIWNACSVWSLLKLAIILSQA